MNTELAVAGGPRLRDIPLSSYARPTVDEDDIVLSRYCALTG